MTRRAWWLCILVLIPLSLFANHDGIAMTIGYFVGGSWVWNYALFERRRLRVDIERETERRMVAVFEAALRQEYPGVAVRYTRGDDLAAADAVIREVQS